MKKVIDGKIYNTDTAEKIAEDSYGFPSDFRYWSEVLYVTKKGNFFIAGEGGALTKYGISCGGGSSCGSSRIEPVSEEMALNWCQAHDVDANVIEELFKDFVEEA